MFSAMTTEEKWSERVTGWRSSGLTAAKFCAGKGFTEGGLRYWASKLKRAQGEAHREGLAEGVRIARVVRTPMAVEVAATATETSIVIEVGGARVAVRRGFDGEVLREVLAVLGGTR